MTATFAFGVPVANAALTPVSDHVTASLDGDDEIPNDFMDLERDLSQCISSNPLPGCGREPTSPGDRGGWQQFVLFGVMMSGIGIIFWRIARSVRARDRVARADEKASP